VFRPVSTGGAIGHESRMFTATFTSDGVKAVTYTVIWRYGTVKAALLAVGLPGMVDPAQVVALARKQQARIVMALA
jgi:hypothetical protein